MPLSFDIFGDNAILISWQNKIDDQISRDIYQFNQKLKPLIPGSISETVPAYCSLTIYIMPGISKEKLITDLKGIYQRSRDITINSKLWKIPVCYDVSLALDLETLASSKNLSISKIIELHSKPTYRVDFLGFLPGFPYLSGLNSLLHTPRLTEPRERIEKGSVAIGGMQTGIYPIDSPGGWHIIGRTPRILFDANNHQPCFIKPMDRIKFYSIPLHEYTDD